LSSIRPLTWCRWAPLLERQTQEVNGASGRHPIFLVYILLVKWWF